MKALKKSWKTTLGGILLAAAPFLLKLDPSWAEHLSVIVGAIGALLIGGAARDSNVSSEEAKDE